MTEARYLQLIGATGDIRTATFNGIEHLIVPVVAMVEGVVWAVNAPRPEFVPAEELATKPYQWNGRHAFAGHPKIDGKEVSGNRPEILDQSFGTIFNTFDADKVLKTRRLGFDVYIDPIKASAISDHSRRVIERFRAGERVEVSLGQFVDVEPGKGEWNGKPFDGRWTNIVSDHIAFIEEGKEGACSIEAGCGAPRMAVKNTITETGIELEATTMAEEKPRSLRERFLALFTAALDQAETEVNEPPAAPAPASAPAAAPCACKTLKTAEAGEGTIMSKTDRVKAIIASKKTVFTDADITVLEQLSDDRIVALEASIKASDVPAQPEPVPAPQPTPEPVPTPQPTSVPVTAQKSEAELETEFLKTAPASIRALVEKTQAADKARKTELVNELKTAQSEYTEAELNAMSVEQLERTARLANVQQPIDFSGRGMPRAAAASKDDVFLNPPDPYEEALKARRAALKIQ